MIDSDILEILEFITWRNTQALQELAMEVNRIRESLERIKPDQVYRNQFYIDLLSPRLNNLLTHLKLREDFVVKQIHELKMKLREK